MQNSHKLSCRKRSKVSVYDDYPHKMDARSIYAVDPPSEEPGVRPFALASRAAFRHSQRTAQRVLCMLRARAERIPKADLVVAVRGSAARGDFCRFSDIDMLILAEPSMESSVAHVHSAIQALPWPISIQFWSLADSSFKRYLLFWSSLIQMRYVAGDFNMFCRLRQCVRGELRTLSPSDLLLLHSNDLRRHTEYFDAESPHSYNIKRGLGGVVDNDFVRVLCCHPCFSSLSTYNRLPLLRNSKQALQALTLIKALLHESCGEARENYSGMMDLQAEIARFARAKQLQHWLMLTHVEQEMRDKWIQQF